MRTKGSFNRDTRDKKRQIQEYQKAQAVRRPVVIPHMAAQEPETPQEEESPEESSAQESETTAGRNQKEVNAKKVAQDALKQAGKQAAKKATKTAVKAGARWLAGVVWGAIAAFAPEILIGIVIIFVVIAMYATVETAKEHPIESIQALGVFLWGLFPGLD